MPWCSVFLLLTLSGGASAPLHAPARGVGAAPRVSPAAPVVVVDAGHGGHDPGTSHFGLKEKHLALDLAKRLRRHLEASGAKVVMTRESDRFIPLSGRPAIANRLRATLFVSVHINANRSRKISGIEVYYPRTSVAPHAQWPPAVEAAEVGVPSTAVKQTLWDLVLGRTRSSSRALALTLCRSMRQGLQTNCRGAKPAKFVVLREAWMPAVLVEVGYVSNEEEARRLSRADYREAAAQSMAQGIVAHLREMQAL